MAQPLRVEDYFPPLEEIQRPRSEGSDLSTPAGVRRFLHDHGAGVKRLEAHAGRIIEGGAKLLRSARMMPVEMLEPTITELETLESELAATFKVLIAGSRDLLRLARTWAQLRAPLAEFHARDVAATNGTLRAIRETRWQLMALVEAKRPSEHAATIRSVADLAKLFDESSGN